SREGSRISSHRPSIDDERAVLAMQQDQVEHVQGIDGSNAFDQGGLPVSVEGLESETTRVHLAPFRHELLELHVHGHVTGKCFVTQLGEATLDAHGDARSVEKHRSFESFSMQASRLKKIDQSDRPLE